MLPVPAAEGMASWALRVMTPDKRLLFAVGNLAVLIGVEVATVASGPGWLWGCCCIWHRVRVLAMRRL